jgi:hypothetical protein
MGTFLKGALVGGLAAGLVFATTAALAGTGIGAVFNLGQENRVSAKSTLTGHPNNWMLQVTNSGAGSSAGAIRAINGSLTAPALKAINPRGPAAFFRSSTDTAPFTVNSGVKVAHLNAELWDGEYLADFLTRCTAGAVTGYASIAGASLDASYVDLSSGAYRCGGGSFTPQAKRSGTGVYQVDFGFRTGCCPTAPCAETIAVATIRGSAGEIATESVSEPTDIINISKCLVQVRTFDSSGVAADRAFTVAVVRV